MIAVAVTTAVALGQSDKPFYYDARAYWDLSDTFVRDGGFSLFNFSDALRGYAFPLLNLGLSVVADFFSWSDASVVKLFNALIFALIAAVLVPSLAERIWPSHLWGAGRRLFLTLLLLIFWHGYLDFPPTDFAALALALLALLATGHSYSLAWMLVCGLATAGAINFRPAYVVLLPVVIVLVAIDRRRSDGGVALASWRGWSSIGMLVAAFLLVSLPQAMISNRHHDVLSIIPGAPANLSTLQLTYGLQMQRYDTYVGNAAGPRLVYGDRTGKRLLAAEGDEITSKWQYARLVVSQPVQMGGIFGRHIINGLDQRYSTPYLERFNSRENIPMRATGLFLVLVALLRVGWLPTRRGLGSTNWRYLIGLVLCSAPALISAVETRFMLPVFLASWMVVLAPGWSAMWGALAGARRVRAELAGLFVALLLAMVLIANVVARATDDFHAGT